MSARERARLSQSDPEYAPREPDWLTNQDNEREIGSQTVTKGGRLAHKPQQ